jgi:hypothetical protein
MEGMFMSGWIPKTDDTWGPWVQKKGGKRPPLDVGRMYDLLERGNYVPMVGTMLKNLPASASQSCVVFYLVVCIRTDWA